MGEGERDASPLNIDTGVFPHEAGFSTVRRSSGGRYGRSNKVCEGEGVVDNVMMSWRRLDVAGQNVSASAPQRPLPYRGCAHMTHYLSRLSRFARR